MRHSWRQSGLSNGDLLDVDGNVVLAVEERQQCEIFSRVMGYLAPTWLWNTGKKSEFADRKVYRERDLREFRGKEQEQLDV